MPQSLPREQARSINHYRCLTTRALAVQRDTVLGTLDFERKPLLEKITGLYEDRSKETNESKRSVIYEEINRISTEAAKLAIPNEMDRAYSNMGAKVSMLTLGMRKPYTKSTYHQTA